MAKFCLEDGCNNPRFGKGFCKWHQHRRTDLKTKQQPQKRINPISDKLTYKLSAYRPLRDAYMKDNPDCEICGKPSNDLHHKAGRGKFLCDVTTFMAVCRKCHNFIHENPKKSRDSLYLL